LAQYPFVKLTNRNNRDIANSNPYLVITVYGTVAPEFAAMGCRCLTAGDNPTAAYSFVLNPNSKNTYFEYIVNPPMLSLQSPETERKIQEFFYMHYLHSDLPGSYIFTPWKNCSPPQSPQERLKSFIFDDFERQITLRLNNMTLNLGNPAIYADFG
jgi:hypothetical protein